MARPKKDSQVVNLNIERSIYDKFTEFCDNTGLTKTVVVERALEMYIDAMNKNPEKLMQNKK
ncbi:hypothetical protein [Pseudobutyrivibrio sp.]|uniref:hypothetical protein n=1 Tax=Pseudobutyrivibrio sp. TaxID=2014367 RepID=UPI0025E3910B|nr:hypothetical protein [Pseudobutyrivibrio sp.]